MQMGRGEAELSAGLCTSRLALHVGNSTMIPAEFLLKKYYFVHSGTAASGQRHLPFGTNRFIHKPFFSLLSLSCLILDTEDPSVMQSSRTAH